MIFQGPITEEDQDWLCGSTEHQSQHSFLCVVKPDLSWEIFRWDQDDKSLKMTHFVRVEHKGWFATLHRGFWSVQDRLQQLQLVASMGSAVKETEAHCQTGLANIGSEEIHFEEDHARLMCTDFLGAAIAVLEDKSQNADGPLTSEQHQALLDATDADFAVKTVMLSFPGWKSNAAAEPAEVWKQASFRLKAVRSRTTFKCLHDRALEVLPHLVQESKAAEFRQFLADQGAKSKDAAALMNVVGLDGLEETSSDLVCSTTLAFTGQMPSVCAQKQFLYTVLVPCMYIFYKFVPLNVYK